MDTQNYTKDIVSTAEAMLQGKIQLIEGCRKICSLRQRIDDSENAVFLPIRGIESETDHFPLGDFRNKCSFDYLRRMDAEMLQYLDETHESILKSCYEIIQVFSKK